jgi:hypothetical protein
MSSSISPARVTGLSVFDKVPAFLWVKDRMGILGYTVIHRIKSVVKVEKTVSVGLNGGVDRRLGSLSSRESSLLIHRLTISAPSKENDTIVLPPIQTPFRR